MREEIIKIYKFDELDEEVKEKVVEKFWDINVDYEWWTFIYWDAEQIGLQITEFDIGRGGFVRGEWTMTGIETAEVILKEHGEDCETYKDAKKFIEAVNEAKAEFEKREDYDPEYDKFEESADYDDLENEFRRTIREDYRIIFEKEYEELTSREAIEYTIEANEYEFTADGKLY